MKRLISLILLVVAGTTLAFAQQTELATFASECQSSEALTNRKPVTSKWSLFTGEANFANHYLNNHEYSGTIYGFEAIHGRYFRKSDHLSWRLTLTHLRNMHHKMLGSGGLVNPGGTSIMSVQTYEVDYALFYDWTFFDRLQLRAGGSLNIYGGLNGCINGHSINNVLSIDLQTQIYGAAQIRYGWNFNKFGLDLYANISTPLLGVMFVNGRYESFVESLPNSPLTAKGYKHAQFSSFHNMQGANGEVGIDFALRSNVSLCFGVGFYNRYWTAHQLQNYRKNTVLKIGLSVDLVSLKRSAVSSRKF